MTALAFQQEVTDHIGRDNVKFLTLEIAEYARNICAIERNIKGILHPECVQHLEQIIAAARKTGIPLYAISKGYNLGLGSRLPVQDNHVIVDLSKMNRILAYDAELGTIQIEPGVTQYDIARFLEERQATFILNVTGSAADSSVVGNALERGVAHYGSRAEEIISLNALLGNGEHMTTGFAQPHVHATQSYPHGIGPDFRGLFFQSNFGIITSVTLRLLPKTACTAFVTLLKNDGVTIADFIDQLREAKNKNLLPENLHMSNKARRLSVMTPLIARQQKISLQQARNTAERYIAGEWAATISLRGERIVLESVIQCLNRLFKKSAKVSAFYDSDLKPEKDSMHAALKGTIGHALGRPCSDALLSLGYGLNLLIDRPLAETDAGALFLIPVLPFRGRHFVEITNCINTCFQQYGFDAYMTFNLVDHINLEGVVNLVFSRADHIQTNTAHECVQYTLATLENAGYPPMRLGINQKSALTASHTSLRKNLKNYFDPDNILARGRYE
jgi:4-cresol dehydrogenase (hydroxylating)